LRPNVTESDRRRLTSGKYRKRHASNGDLLDGTRVRDLRVQEQIGLGPTPIAHPPVQRFAPIDHVEKRGELRLRGGPIGPSDQLGKRSQRERRWNRRDEYRVGAREDAFSQ